MPRRKPCKNCGELVREPDEHYVDAERVGCWWTCPSVAETRERIRALRARAAEDTAVADRLSKRRAQRMEARNV